jgi:hypothetical protein
MRTVCTGAGKAIIDIFTENTRCAKRAQFLLLFSSDAFNLTAKLHLSVCQHVHSTERSVNCSEPFVKGFITALVAQTRWLCVQMF